MNTEKAICILIFYRDFDRNINLIRRQLNDIDEQYGAVQFIIEPNAANIPQDLYEERTRLEIKIKKMQDLRIAIESEMDRLPYIQKNIIIKKYIHQMKWVQISAQCYYCERQCKYIREKALKKLCVYFAENPMIANYNFPY